MAANLTKWTKHVAAFVPLCPDPVIENAALYACRDFCQKTLLWDENELDAIDIVATDHTYDLTSTDGDIVAVDFARVDGVPIDPVSVNELNRTQRQWRDLTVSRPSRYIVGMIDEIRLVYTPSKDLTGGLEVWVCLKPLETATSVPDFLYRDYQDTITYGTVARLLEIPNMLWSDIKLSAHFGTKYENGRDTAKSKKFTGRTRYEMKTAPAFFA